MRAPTAAEVLALVGLATAIVQTYQAGDAKRITTRVDDSSRACVRVLAHVIAGETQEEK